MARAMHQVRNVVAAVDVRGLQPGQTTDIHTCCHKVLQLCEKYSTSPTSCGYYFFDSKVRSNASTMTVEETQGNLYSRFSSPDQMYDPLAFALDDLSLGADMTPIAEESVGAGTAMQVLRESLLSLVHQFPWHAISVEQQDREKKTWETEPNLLVLFTPWVHVSSASLNVSKADLVKSLVRELKGVGKILTSQGIHLCWVNVEHFSGLSSTDAQPNDRFAMLAAEQFTIRSRFAQLNWSFWDLEFLMSSAATIPFSLVWPSIAFPAVRLPCRETFTSADVLLEVEDCGMTKVEAVSHVELYDLTFLQPGSNPWNRRKCCLSGDGLKRIPGQAAATVTVTRVLPKHEARPDWLVECDTFLMWTCSNTESVENDWNCHLPDAHAFKLLQQDRCEFDHSKPSFQLFLLQLARARAAAVVQFSHNEYSYAALLEPVTVHCATLSIVTSKESSLLATISCSPKLARLSSRYRQVHVGVKQPIRELQAVTRVNSTDMWKSTEQEEQAGLEEPGTGNRLRTTEAENSTLVEANTADQASVVALGNDCKKQEQEQKVEVKEETADPLVTERGATPSTIEDACVVDIERNLFDERKVKEEREEQAGPSNEPGISLVAEEVSNPKNVDEEMDKLTSLVEAANRIADGAIQKLLELDVSRSREMVSMVHKEADVQSTEPDFEVLFRELSAPVLVAVEQQTRHLDVPAGPTEMMKAEQGYADGQTQGLISITSPDVTVQIAECLSNPEVMDVNAAGTSDENSARPETDIITQLQSLVSQGIFSDKEIIRLAVQICRQIKIQFLPSRRGVPKSLQENLQMFFQRYLDPFPAVFKKACEIMEDKGWEMKRVKSQSVRNRIRRQELQAHRTPETYVQIRRKRPNLDWTGDDTEVVDGDTDSSSVVAGKKQRISQFSISPNKIRRR